jgi:hypothetical protein
MVLAVSENHGPKTVADVEAIYNRSWAQAHSNVDRRRADAETRREPLDWTPGQAFAFRTDPGAVPDMKIHIPWKEMDWGYETDTKEGKAKALLLKRWERAHENDSPEWMATLEQAVADNDGKYTIVFRENRANLECFFQTPSPAIAAVVRNYMKTGDSRSRFIREVFPDREILVGDHRFADNNTGVAAALTFMAESGGELKYVKKGTKQPYKARE